MPQFTLKFTREARENLAELEKNGGFLFLALEEIKGDGPIPVESYGKIDEMQAAWIAWGREQGYRW